MMDTDVDKHMYVGLKADYVSDLKISPTSWHSVSNYSYATRSAVDAKTWVQQYAGAQTSKIVYVID